MNSLYRSEWNWINFEFVFGCFAEMDFLRPLHVCHFSSVASTLALSHSNIRQRVVHLTVLTHMHILRTKIRSFYRVTYSLNNCENWAFVKIRVLYVSIWKVSCDWNHAHTGKFNFNIDFGSGFSIWNGFLFICKIHNITEVSVWRVHRSCSIVHCAVPKLCQ